MHIVWQSSRGSGLFLARFPGGSCSADLRNVMQMLSQRCPPSAGLGFCYSRAVINAGTAAGPPHHIESWMIVVKFCYIMRGGSGGSAALGNVGQGNQTQGGWQNESMREKTYCSDKKQSKMIPGRRKKRLFFLVKCTVGNAPFLSASWTGLSVSVLDWQHLAGWEIWDKLNRCAVLPTCHRQTVCR